MESITLPVEAVRLAAIFSPVPEWVRSTSRAALDEALRVTTAGEPVPTEESEMIGEPDVLAVSVDAADVTFSVPVDVPIKVSDEALLSLTQELAVVELIVTVGAFVKMLALLAPIAPEPDARVKVPPVEMLVEAASVIAPAP